MRAVLLCALVALAAAPVWAKDKGPVFVESDEVKDKPVVALDKAKAYVMIRSDAPVATYLMKVPTAADQAAYDQLRADAFQKAREKYLKKQASYEAAVKASAGVPRGSPGSVLPDKPVKPTEQNFQFTPFGVMAGVAIGPINRFAKTGTSTYVQEVTPGDYRVYGPLTANPQGGMIGTCFCMGSVAFTASAGQIVDLGFILTKEAPKFKAADGDASAPVPVADQPYFSAAPAGATTDPRLAALPIVPAVFRAAGKLPNYYGVTITRIPAMPGVIAYDRDRIVDLSAR